MKKLIESINRIVFSIGKVTSSIFMVICMITLIILAINYVFSGPDSVKSPDFDDEIERMESKDSANNSESYETIDERREVEQKYGEDILDIIKDSGANKSYYDDLIDVLTRMDSDHRGRFVDGLEDWISDALDYGKNNEDAGEINIDKCFTVYVSKFNDALIDAESSKLESETSRKLLLTIMGGVFITFIMFLIIPVLLQIEVNTRKVS